MNLQWTGLAAAAAAFGGIWIGHVAVRRIEFRAPRLGPVSFAAAALGLGAEYLAARFAPGPSAAALGILGLTFLFDAFELFRQFRRVREGRARANPRNPRHAPYLASGAATAADPLVTSRLKAARLEPEGGRG